MGNLPRALVGRIDGGLGWGGGSNLRWCGRRRVRGSPEFGGARYNIASLREEELLLVLFTSPAAVCQCRSRPPPRQRVCVYGESV